MVLKKKPAWLHKKVCQKTENYTRVLLKDLELNTVCEEARCPNISECFSNRHATFLIMGDVCTRSCEFCNVKKAKDKNLLKPLDPYEPERVAQAVERLNLSHVVITSPTRDDIFDGGALHFANTIKAIRNLNPNVTIEVLVPDFKGDTDSIKTVIGLNPEIFGHNLETVPRLYAIRKGASFERSLYVLESVKKLSQNVFTKTGIMLGLGETMDELKEVFERLIKINCDFISIGQYLRPSLKNVEVYEYVHPDKFEEIGEIARNFGFKHVESAPYVRSSYNAQKYLSCGRS
ncbi:Lipoyl synthase [Thermodesulfobium narugense DSM 14796]|uniref:Lipoyl synthase n=1 Tax=Thermodesulfobium narugense DSM 14796 TaxID=747365 RepID=M1E7S7_9BACT|nr:Lipoyl synthase [Thermodesulfobium narugense DSM 14796]